MPRDTAPRHPKERWHTKGNTLFHHDNLHPGLRHRRREEHNRMQRDMQEQLHRSIAHGFGHQGFGRRGRHDPAHALREAFGEGRRGGVVRRGEVRPLILRALLERPMHGYELMQALETQSGGRWRPSAGSIYPTLQQLADEGLVSGSEVDGRRTYTLTDAGRGAAEASIGPTPWASADADDPSAEPDIFGLLSQLAAAAVQVAKVGSPDVRREAVKTLTESRKQLYRLLSEDEPAETADAVQTVETPEGDPEA
jgi:DNA-binding PadR family transcriptional regulator